MLALVQADTYETIELVISATDGLLSAVDTLTSTAVNQ